ncbi:MAG: hypothetical protein CBB97_07905 [Candidatus Endolissoclinum sp. TMED37]|nr:MAG: hypothetical protein CBB97_07905 [Candidatus Endolissoclinum sp. TMED37]|tara:strand:+ start:1671 stop:2624 length:954 start_codon:yes stop_codon:yes gene_type:complete
MKKKVNQNKFCIIGLGKHASDNLLPSLRKANKRIIAYVSRTSKKRNRSFIRFRNIETAIKHLPKNINFVVSTPPNTHFNILTKLIRKNTIIFVEKPIFVSLNETKQFINLLKGSKSLIIEIFMYRYTNFFKKFLNKVNSLDDITDINCNFLVPGYPERTFRDDVSLSSSCLYDIGSYIIDMFTEMNFKLTNFKLLETEIVNNYAKKIIFKFKAGSINCKSEIGLGKSYKNSVLIKTKKQEKFEFTPFFYGKKGFRKIKSNLKENLVFENNSFEKMFRINSLVKYNQSKALNKMLISSRYLDELSVLLQKEIDRNEVT